MGFLDFDIEDAQEPTVIPANTEVQLRITSAEKGIDKNNHPYLLTRLDTPDDPMVKEFTYFLGYPHKDMDERKANNAKWKFKVFFEAIGVDPADVETTEDLQGATFWAIVGVSESDEYGEQNYVKKVIKSA